MKDIPEVMKEVTHYTLLQKDDLMRIRGGVHPPSTYDMTNVYNT